MSNKLSLWMRLLMIDNVINFNRLKYKLINIMIDFIVIWECQWKNETWRETMTLIR